MDWWEVSEGVASGVIVALLAHFLHWLFTWRAVKRERARQLINATEERACFWSYEMQKGNGADQENALKTYSVERRLFYVALRRLKAVLNKSQNGTLAANCPNVVGENPPGSATSQEIEQLFGNLKRLYQTQL